MFAVRRPFDGVQCVLNVNLEAPFRVPGTQVKRLPLEMRECRAVIDTGSSRTLVRAALASEMGLTVTTVEMIEHPTHPEPVPCLATFATLSMLNDEGACWTFNVDLLVAAGLMKYDVVLGADAFEQGILSINYRDKWWAFSAA